MNHNEMRVVSTAPHLRRQWQQQTLTTTTSSSPRRGSVNKCHVQSSWKTKSSTICRYNSLCVVLVVVLLVGVFPGSCYGDVSSTGKSSAEKVFTNGWAIKVVGEHPQERVKRIAQKYGFDKISKVCKFLYKNCIKYTFSWPKYITPPYQFNVISQVTN